MNIRGLMVDLIDEVKEAKQYLCNADIAKAAQSVQGCINIQESSWVDDRTSITLYVFVVPLTLHSVQQFLNNLYGFRAAALCKALNYTMLPLLGYYGLW